MLNETEVGEKLTDFVARLERRKHCETCWRNVESVEGMKAFHVGTIPVMLELLVWTFRTVRIVVDHVHKDRQETDVLADAGQPV